VQFEVVSQPSLLELALALMVRYNRDVDLLEDVLVLAEIAEGVLAPASCVATRSSIVVLRVWQTGCANVRTEEKTLVSILIFLTQMFNLLSLQVNRPDQLDDSKIVEQSAGIKFRVDCDTGNISFDVRVELNIVVDVPFSQANSELLTSVSEK